MAWGSNGARPTKVRTLSANLGHTVNMTSVLEPAIPQADKLYGGFENLMPPIPLEEREVQGVVTFLQSLKEGP